ncbi:putative peptidase [Euzebya pacifica]|uniref:Putative peptidase n=1 Tax=Euzebya pacifica TaxID=1608957 RepID=A0A346XWZ6_9ACTN|nr:M48 family metallopeptidase [Euzebya pacifica]AXV06743.1 putative peptidase [Euzebya pacifica]
MNALDTQATPTPPVPGAGPRPPARPNASTLRHRAEVPVLVLCSALTIGGAGVAVVALLGRTDVPEPATIALVGLAIPLVAAAVAIRVMFWSLLARGVETSPTQLPELHGMLVTLTDRMGLRRRPRLMVVNGHGLVNAMAAKCTLRRGYVVLSSDLVDIAYEVGDWDVVRFALAHELGHIAAGHTALWRLAIRPLPKLIGLDRWLVRTQEYTADRWAAAICDGPPRSFLALLVGKRVHRHVDVTAHLATVEEAQHAGWLRVVNALAGHPVGHRRFHALVELDRKGWGAHGRMC